MTYSNPPIPLKYGKFHTFGFVSTLANGRFGMQWTSLALPKKNSKLYPHSLTVMFHVSDWAEIWKISSIYYDDANG